MTNNFFIHSTYEFSPNNNFIFIVSLLMLIMVSFLGYVLYTFVYKRPKFNLWIQDIKHGYIGVGMPTWWQWYSTSYLGYFHQYVGLTCVSIYRVIVPNFPALGTYIENHTFLQAFTMIMYLAGYIYITVFSLCKFWSSFKYLITGQFLKFNSPIQGGPTTRRIISSILTATGLGGSVAAGTIGAIVGTDYIQEKVFRATPDQYLTTKMCKGVDYIKEQAGYPIIAPKNDSVINHIDTQKVFNTKK